MSAVKEKGVVPSEMKKLQNCDKTQRFAVLASKKRGGSDRERLARDLPACRGKGGLDSLVIYDVRGI